MASVVDTLLRSLVPTPKQNDKVIANPQGNGFQYLLDVFGLKDNTQPTDSTAHLFNDIYACVNVLSDDVAKLPIKVFRNVDGQIKKETNHQIQYLLGTRPNPYMTPFSFKKMIVTDLCFAGNFYALIEYDKKGKTTALHPLTATNVNVVVDANSNAFYYETLYKNERVLLHPHEIIHIKGMSRDGYRGISPVRVISEQVLANKTAVKMNLKILESGGTPQGILKFSSSLDTKSKVSIRDKWKQVNSEDAIAILDSGMEYQQIGVSQADLQFLEGQKFNQQQIAAVYKVPLHKINQLDHATYTNIESQSIDYVKNTLQPLVVQIEEEFNYKLFLGTQNDIGCYTKFNLDSELRGTSKDRAIVQEINIRSGAKTVNEVRVQNEDSPYAISYADEPMMTLNYAPMGTVAEVAKSRVDNNGLSVATKGGEIDGENYGEENDID